MAEVPVADPVAPDARSRAREWRCTLAELPDRVSDLLPGLSFERVLSRGGWHRIGGVVDADHARIAAHLERWAEQESGGDVNVLLAKYADAGYLATRVEGTAHYLTAASGPAAEEFVQVEVEELEEIVLCELVDSGAEPSDIEELVDPLHPVRLEPERVGEPRMVLRRIVRVPDWLRERKKRFDADPALPRFFADWERSSAGTRAPLCRHWVLAFREWVDSTGAAQLSGRPIPVARPGAALMSELREWSPALRGAPLARRLRAFDRHAGYAFAWYFHMLFTTDVSFEVARAVLADLDEGLVYLPDRDVAVLRGWGDER